MEGDHRLGLLCSLGSGLFLSGMFLATTCWMRMWLTLMRIQYPWHCYCCCLSSGQCKPFSELDPYFHHPFCVLCPSPGVFQMPLGLCWLGGHAVTEFVPLHDIPYILLSLDRAPYLSIDEFLASPDRHLDLSAYVPDFPIP